MSFRSSLRALFRNLVRRTRVERELEEEVQSYVALLSDENLAFGMSRKEARRAAILSTGGIEQIKGAVREERLGRGVEILLGDVAYALRGFRRNAVFTFTVIVTLTLGIGAATAVFSVVDRVLFRSLPYAHDDRIVSVGLVQSLERQEFTVGGFFFEWRDHQRPFEAFASQQAVPHGCDLIETNPAQLSCIGVQAGFLPLLGISPVLGRNFLPEEDRPNGPRVVLISYRLWMSRYSRDPGILGRLINLEGSPARVIGVLPKDFELPTLQPADVIVPLALNEAEERKRSPGSPMRTFARLRPGVSIAQAKEELEPLFRHTQLTLIPSGIRNDFHLSVRSLRDRETQDVQLAAWILLGSVLAVLLIACANVASLMMARGAARERERAVRSALGASRGRLVRQTLTEAFLLSLAGAATGMLLAEGLLRVFVAIAPTSIPFLGKARLDLRIALFTILLSLLCGVIFGLAPAIEKPRISPAGAYTTSSGKHAFLRQSLVVGQIAVSMILLSGAALLLRSFRNMVQQNLGMQTSGVSAVWIALPQSRYDTGQKKMQFYLQAEDALRRVPGIQAVGWTDSFPPGGWQDARRFADLAVAGRPRPTPGIGGSVVYRKVTPGYFRALDIPILRGRGFTEEDRSSSEERVVLSQLLASRLFPGEDALGERVQMVPGGAWYTVAGVAGNVKNGGLAEADEPEIYSLRRDLAADWDGRLPVTEDMGGGAAVMVLATVQRAAAVVPWVRSTIGRLDPTVPVQIEPLTARVSKMADRPRFETALLTFFALSGFLIAVIGLYGVISFLATQRTREIGIRMALGAGRADILGLLTWEGVRLIALGGILGVGVSLGISRLLKSLLFNVGPHDPISFIAVAALLALVALAATLIPARSAMKVDPIAALRYE